MPRLTVAVPAILLLWISAQPTATAQAGGSAARGERLFRGDTAFRNGGPACIGCHSIAGIPFPNGGTLGPELTHAYRKLGPTGTQSAMQTLYFKVMTPIYGVRPLFPDEQTDLMAFLQQADAGTPAEGNTEILLGAGVALGGIFVALTGFLGRKRVKSVRRALVERATGGHR